MTLKIAILRDRNFRWTFLPSRGLPSSNNYGWPAIDVVKKWVRDNYSLYDSDACGNQKFYVVLGEEGSFSFFKVEHEWYWEGWGTDQSHLHNEFDVYPKTEAEARLSVKNWLVV